MTATDYQYTELNRTNDTVLTLTNNVTPFKTLKTTDVKPLHSTWVV